MINGSPTNVFAAKRGLRHGDPLSPLLFVIGMDYLSRSLKNIVGTFGFHPRCKSINVTHLCFADDLMVFCKGDLCSVRVICDCIKVFSNTSGLHANAGKSTIYLAGIDSSLKEDIRDVSQFSLGTLPFRYLGVPLSSKRLSIAECEQLADKMTKRISTWQSKHLSYAARLQLITSVLIGITSYWCQIFILPKRVITIVNSICRSFLWFGVAQSSKPGNINWKSLCTPKTVGGLGLRNIQLWNQAAVGKIAWHISIMKETLWVTWVHGVYTKGAKWEIFNAPVTASWTIKKLCQVTTLLRPWICKNEYFIKEVYESCLGNPPTMHWRHLVWNRLSIPKTRFICWLAAK